MEVRLRKDVRNEIRVRMSGMVFEKKEGRLEFYMFEGMAHREVLVIQLYEWGYVLDCIRIRM